MTGVVRILGAAMLICGALDVLPDAAQAACNGGPILKGSYGVLVNGANTSPANVAFSVGNLTFDGKCGIFGYLTRSINGIVFLGVPANGTYNQNSDGTFTVALTPWWGGTPQTFAVGYSATAGKALGIEQDPATPTITTTITMQAQVTNPTAPALVYTNATLAGTWVVSCFSAFGSTDLNLVTFDGAGNISSSSKDYYNNSGTVSNAIYTGTYSMNTDGEFVGAAFVGGVAGQNVFNFVGVVDHQQTEIQYTYYQNGAGVTACSGVRS